MTGMFDKLAADGLTEFSKHKPTRVQKLQEENEAIQYLKKHPDAGQKKQLRFKAIEIMKKKGMWKSAEDQIIEEKKELEQQLNQGKLSPEEYKEKNAKLLGRQTKLTKEIAKKQQAKEATEIANKEQEENNSDEIQSEDEDLKETERKEK